MGLAQSQASLKSDLSISLYNLLEKRHSWKEPAPLLRVVSKPKRVHPTLEKLYLLFLYIEDYSNIKGFERKELWEGFCGNRICLGQLDFNKQASKLAFENFALNPFRAL